jgi:phage shock protein E
MPNKSIKIIISLALAMAFHSLSAQVADSTLARLIEGGALLVDVRTAEEFATGHAEGSINIPVDELKMQLSKFEGQHHILVFCKTGNRSERAKTLLNAEGFEKVTNAGSWQDIARVLSAKENEEH